MKLIGEDPACYSSHSFRWGGASFASQAGVERELIMLIGDWRSEAVDQYIQYSLAQKVSAAQTIRNALK